MALFIIQQPLPPLSAFPVTSSRILSFALLFTFFLFPTATTPKMGKNQGIKWNKRHERSSEKRNLTKTIKSDFFQADELVFIPNNYSWQIPFLSLEKHPISVLPISWIQRILKIELQLTYVIGWRKESHLGTKWERNLERREQLFNVQQFVFEK